MGPDAVEDAANPRVAGALEIGQPIEVAHDQLEARMLDRPIGEEPDEAARQVVALLAERRLI